MTQDTEDVVARVTRFAETLSVNRHYMTGQTCMEVQDDLRALIADRQSLSDHIDVLEGALALIDRQAEVPTKPMLFVGTKRRQEHYLLCYVLSSIKDTARAALHRGNYT